jgi:hypothetical protein
MAKKLKRPTGPPEEYMIGADAKIGLGRVIEWIDGTDEIRVELIGEDGYHFVGIYELTIVTHPSTPGMERCRQIANMPPIVTYRTGPTKKRSGRGRGPAEARSGRGQPSAGH